MPDQACIKSPLGDTAALGWQNMLPEATVSEIAMFLSLDQRPWSCDLETAGGVHRLMYAHILRPPTS